MQGGGLRGGRDGWRLAVLAAGCWLRESGCGCGWVGVATTYGTEVVDKIHCEWPLAAVQCSWVDGTGWRWRVVWAPAGSLGASEALAGNLAAPTRGGQPTGTAGRQQLSTSTALARHGSSQSIHRGRAEVSLAAAPWFVWRLATRQRQRIRAVVSLLLLLLLLQTGARQSRSSGSFFWGRVTGVEVGRQSRLGDGRERLKLVAGWEVDEDAGRDGMTDGRWAVDGTHC